MFLLRKLLWHAARHIALDPRARAKAADVFEKEVKPRFLLQTVGQIECLV